MTTEEYKQKARWIRQQTVNMTMAAGMGHIAPAFSCTEILTTLYYGNVLRYRPDEPDWPDRDRFILSKGQACAALYAILADLGFIDEAELLTHSQNGSRLGGHSESNIPGVECYTGSLGHGLGIAVGMAYAAKLDKKDWKVYCLLGDGECQEGSVWEAAMLASHLKLDNLIAIVDRNEQQAIDFTKNVSSVWPLAAKFRAFGWSAGYGEGHDVGELIDEFTFLHATRPTCIVAKTVKGKGVPQIEGVPIWHYRVPESAEEQKWFVDALYDEPPAWYTPEVDKCDN